MSNKLYSLSILAGQVDFLGRTIYAYLVLSQPIHTQDNIQFFRLNQYQRRRETDFVDPNFQIAANKIALNNRSWGLYQHILAQKRTRKFVLGNKTP